MKPMTREKRDAIIEYLIFALLAFFFAIFFFI